MLSREGTHIICDGDRCIEQIGNHYWGKVKAVGWFFSKDGKAFCPQHVPEWYDRWKKVRR